MDIIKLFVYVVYFQDVFAVVVNYSFLYSWLYFLFLNLLNNFYQNGQMSIFISKVNSLMHIAKHCRYNLSSRIHIMSSVYKAQGQ